MKKINLQMFALNKNLNAVNLPDQVKSTKVSEASKMAENIAKAVANINPTAQTSGAVLGAYLPSSLKKTDAPSLAGVSTSITNQMNSQFNASPSYASAMAYTNQLLEQINSGKTSYSDRIDNLLKEIQGRDKFAYDVDKDPLFQQALASYANKGNLAMQDTMGQAAALTGGYGSSYATSAGNQAYNAYLQDAYNNIPEYYNMALEAYNAQGNELYKQLGALNDADANEYGRRLNAYNANFNNAQQMYQNEYNAWASGVNNAMNLANMYNAEYWKNKTFDEDVRQYNASLIGKTSGGSTNQSYSEEYPRQLTQDEMKRFLEIFNEDGYKGVERELGSYTDPLDEASIDGLWDYIQQFGEDRNKTGYKKISNDAVIDEYGNKYKISDLPYYIRKYLEELSINEIYK